ncbi:hypothetical protein ACOI1H_19985 [Loktanella sp. DJP18]|uniref:hypothetical protein n=1 Tax=Loktanella sp. DJP18 TaxID=3409788 RepID=UPI003BB6496A
MNTRSIVSPLPSEMLEATTTFRHWAGTDTDVISGDDVGQVDFTKPGPFIVRAYHGTTHGFSAFEAKHHGNPEGAFGCMHYFTSSVDDAEQNYACEGPDLTSRIEQATEQLIYSIEEDLEAYGLPDDADSDAIRAKAQSLSYQRLHGDNPRIIEAYLRFDKPFRVNGQANVRDRTRTPLLLPDVESGYADVEDEVLREHDAQDLTDDEREEALETYADEITERYDAQRETAYATLEDAFRTAAIALEIEPPVIPDAIGMDPSDVTQDQFYKILHEAEETIYIDCPNTGALIVSEFTARVIAALGFDAIILFDADCKFERMNIPSGTAHIHIFDEHRNRIKSVTNRGTFCPASADIEA